MSKLLCKDTRGIWRIDNFTQCGKQRIIQQKITSPHFHTQNKKSVNHFQNCNSGLWRGKKCGLRQENERR